MRKSWAYMDAYTIAILDMFMHAMLLQDVKGFIEVIMLQITQKYNLIHLLWDFW